jgi:hypothetical protein
MSPSSRPDQQFLGTRRSERERHLAWFHEVTESMSEEQIRAACTQRGIPMDGKTLHDLQSALLLAGAEFSASK